MRIFVKTFFIMVIVLITKNNVVGQKTKDDLPSGTEKGYVSFLAPGYTIYQMVNGSWIEEIKISGTNIWDYRIAKVPGNYTFKIEADTKDKTDWEVNVKIEANATTYVTRILAKLKIDHLAITYKTSFTVGSHYIPLIPNGTEVKDLICSLDDNDLRTRYWAVDALKKLFEMNPKMDTREIVMKLKNIYSNERYKEMREKICDYFEKTNQPLELTNDDYTLWDGFTDDEGRGSWLIGQNSYYSLDGYNIDNNTDGPIIISDKGKQSKGFLCKKKRKVYDKLTDFDIYLTCTWKYGATDYNYGFLIGKDRENAYVFTISKGGWESVSLFKDNKFISNLLDFQLKDILKDGMNILKVEVREGNTMTYYVNDFKIGSVKNDAKFDYKFYGLIVAGKQGICFNMIRIFNYADNLK